MSLSNVPCNSIAWQLIETSEDGEGRGKGEDKEGLRGRYERMCVVHGCKC